MPFSLVPDRIFDTYTQITPEYLRSRDITLLLSDLDFTLAAKKTRRPDQPLRDWIAALRAELKKETQFSRKVELNMRIKNLEQKILG